VNADRSFQPGPRILLPVTSIKSKPARGEDHEGTKRPINDDDEYENDD
jgi:hypothetical protein